MMPDQEAIPTASDSGDLQRSLFVVNSKIMELTNLQNTFEQQEAQSLNNNYSISSALNKVMFFEVAIVVILAVAQYYFMKNFVKGVRG